jgi:hypothetical protein
MMAEALKLVTYADECNVDLVEVLEEILEGVKKGEFVSGAIVVQRKNGNIMTRWSKSENTHVLIAGCSYLQYDLLKSSD